MQGGWWSRSHSGQGRTEAGCCRLELSPPPTGASSLGLRLVLTRLQVRRELGVGCSSCLHVISRWGRHSKEERRLVPAPDETNPVLSLLLLKYGVRTQSALGNFKIDIFCM